MKALLLEEAGKWREMKTAEVDKPIPEAGEVLVKIYAAGLNPVDYKTATGGNPAWSYPHILGLDASGVVEELGEGVTHLKKGDRVFYHGAIAGRSGSFAQYGVTSAHTVARIPEGLSFEEAAALPCAGMTAYQALFRKMNLQKGETILIHGGAGGVGGFAVQLASQAGAVVISTCSSSNKEYVTELGARYVIDYNEENVLARVMALTNGLGADGVLDTVSRQNATDSLPMIAFNGRLAFIAGKPDYDQVKPFSQALSFHEIALGAAHNSGNRKAQEDLARMNEELAELVVKGKVSAMVSEVIGMEDIPSALEKLSDRHVRGKIVAKMV